MAYTRTTWVNGDLITAEKLNNIEGGIVANESDVADLNNAINEDETLLEKTVTVGKNKWNPSAVSANTNISNNPTYLYGETIEQSGYYTSDYIAVNGGDTVSWYYNNNASAAQVARSTMYRVAEYDATKTVVRVSANWAGSPFTTADNTKFVRIVLNQNQPLNMIVLNETVTPIFFEAYQTTTEFGKITEIEAEIAEIEEDIGNIENPADVILPSAIYGVNGQEINIYKENLVLNNRLKSLAYIHTRFSANAWQDDERTIWTPSATELSETTQAWELFYYGLKETDAVTIKECLVPKDTGNSNKKVLVIGDSKVDNGLLTYHFLHNFDDDNMSVTLLGSKYDWTTDNRNEGWGGRTAKWFCTDSGSPLSNNGACDFAHYQSTYSIDTPDFVFINLGTNDCASLSGGNDTFITEFVTYITQMITSIHSVSSSIEVIIGMCEGVSTVQDTNNAEFDKWDLNQKISRLHKATITAFDNRQNEHIWVCPMYMGMDLTQDYNMTEVPLSKRDGDVNNGSGDGKTRMQITDRVHQNEVGYWKNADYMYALVKYIVAKSL